MLETVKLNYKEFGEGNPMVILHGLMGSLDNWQTMASKRFANYFHVFTVDQRNHGQSPHTSEMDYEYMSADLLRFLDEQNIEKAILLGHSMGGKTVMKFALDHPDRILGLISADISPKAYPVHHDHILEALEGVDFNVMKSRTEIEEFLMQKLGNKAVVLFLTKNIYWAEKDRLDYRFNLDALKKNIEVISGWPSADHIYLAPTLFIRGEKSDYINDLEPSIDDLFPNHELITIEGAGHWLHAEKPMDFCEAVIEYLREQRLTD